MIILKPLALLKKSISSVPKVVVRGGSPIINFAKSVFNRVKAIAGFVKRRSIAAALLLAIVIIASYFIMDNESIQLKSVEEQQVTLQTVPEAENEETAMPAPDLVGSTTVPAVNMPAVETSLMEVLTRPTAGEVVKTFGFSYAPTFDDYRYHKGIDIQSNQDAQIQAIEGGTVEQALPGFKVMINHGEGWISIYEGIDEVQVVEGQQVKKGDVIAVLGKPGREEAALGPHLHLEILKDGEPVDPIELLKQQ